MKAQQFIVLTLGLALTLTGCIPAIIIGAAYSSSKTEETRGAFLAELNRTNTEREKNGLAPLDRCVEMYRFDPGWAKETAECRATVDSLRRATDVREPERFGK